MELVTNANRLSSISLESDKINMINMIPQKRILSQLFQKIIILIYDIEMDFSIF